MHLTVSGDFRLLLASFLEACFRDIMVVVRKFKFHLVDSEALSGIRLGVMNGTLTLYLDCIIIHLLEYYSVY